MADTTATAAEHADSPAKPRLSTDAKWIVATGVTIALLQVAFVSMTFQQNAIMNARIDDTNQLINQRFNDQNQRFNDQNHRIDQMQTDIRDIRTEMRETRTEMQTEMREMRSLPLQTLERTAPANPVD